MQARVGVLDIDVMPILHNHCLGYRHNFALFYQLLDSNLFTHLLFAIMREASSETYGPRVYFSSYKFPICNISFRFTTFAIFYFRSIKQKHQKIFTLPFFYLYQISLLQVTVKGWTTPLLRWVQVV